MLSAWLVDTAEAAHSAQHTPFPAYTYAIVAAVFFTLALMFTFTYRHVGKARGEAGTADHS